MTPLPPGAGFMWPRTFVWVYNWSMWPCLCPMLIMFERFVYVLWSPCIRLREARTGRKGKKSTGVFDGNRLSGDHETRKAWQHQEKGSLAQGKHVLSQVPVTTESLPRAASPLWAVSISTVAVSRPIGLFHHTVSQGQMLESEFHTTVKAMTAEAGWRWRRVLPQEHCMSRSISKPNEKGKNEESVLALTSWLLGIRHFDFIFTSLSGCSLARWLPFLMLILWCEWAWGYRRLSPVHLLKSRSLNQVEAWSPFKVYLLH